MAFHECLICEKIFKLKSDYMRHVNRKFPCKKQEYVNNQKKPETQMIEPKNMKHKINTFPNLHTNSEKKEESLMVGGSSRRELCFGQGPKQTKNKCVYCLKIFSSNSHWNRHIKNNCKIKRQQENEKELIFKKLMEQFDIQNKKIEKQSKEIEQLKKHNDEIEKKLDSKQIQIGNNNNMITNNNNITIIAHGRENFDKIKENDIIKALIRGTNSVPIITELMHYNDQYPEFQNIYIPNISQKYCMVYDGNDWLLKDNDDTIDSLYATKYGLLEGKFEEFFDKLTVSQQNSFKRFIDLNDKADEDDDSDAKKIISGIKHQLKLLLYNKRKLIRNK